MYRELPQSRQTRAAGLAHATPHVSVRQSVRQQFSSSASVMRIDQTSSQRFPFASVHLHAPAAKEMASTASPIQEHVQVQEWEQVARDLLSSSSLEVDLAAIPVAALGSVMENLQASES